jgi:hypothetical protein
VTAGDEKQYAFTDHIYYTAESIVETKELIYIEPSPSSEVNGSFAG